MKSTQWQRFSSGVIFRRFVFLAFITVAGHTFAGNVTILDKSHYSSVFGEVRNYRIFLPPGYFENQDTKYPVIYYYHGWSQRYFGSINDFKADEGDSNGGDNIANFVATHDVIVVKPDGYNRRPNEEYYLRPYNIGPVETYRQFPLYFPELVNYIDSQYRTIPDREHRAITGLSMGGFMTWWISGMYPHLVSAAGNFCGSVEFFVGPENSPVEYRHLDMFDNYEGVNVRLNYGDKDFIRDYHKDVNKIWTQVMDNYEYKVYHAEHSACGLGEMFEFCLNTFENPPAKPENWNHIDVYPSFEVWEYDVNSDRKIPGFTVLENVNKQGFKCAVRSFLPDGEPMPFVQLSIITPPLYKKDQQYEIRDIDPETGKSSKYMLTSDSDGRLKIDLNGGEHEIGISTGGNAPNIGIASFEVTNMNWASSDGEVDLSVKLLNNGFGSGDELSVKLTATRKSAVVLNDVVRLGTIRPGEIKECNDVFSFYIESDSIEIERFSLHITDKAGNVWSDYIDVRFRNERNEIKDFVIADGKEFKVAAAGDDTVAMFLGKGNGDGIANPGESIVILANENGRLYRTLLHTSDSQVNPFGIHLRESDYWGTYDHVGASAKYSVPVLTSENTGSDSVQFFAEYWLPDYPEHIIRRGIVNIKIAGNDETPPVFRWVNIDGDNTVQAKLYDGGKISSVKAKLVLNEDPSKFFEIELFDDNTHGDHTEGDQVFSNKIEETGFGLYTISVTAEDVYGNVAVQDFPNVMLVH